MNVYSAPSIDRHEGSPPLDGEARLRRILGSAVDYAIIAMDLDGLVIEWNEGARLTLGWSAEEMLGKPASTFFTMEDRRTGIPQAEMKAALTQGRGSDERWHLRKDGSSFWASGEMMPLRDDAGLIQGFIKVLRDRTEQKQAEEKQRTEAEFLRSVLKASNDCIKILDLDGRLEFMSAGGQRVMEVGDFDAISGCSWPGFWRGPLNAEATRAVQAARAGGIGHFQGLADTMAGTTKYWDVQVTPMPGADGKPRKLLSVSRDITDMHTAGAALSESEAHWRGLFEKLREGFILGELVRDADGVVADWRYLDVNPAWGELVGIRPEDARGRTIRDLFPGIEDAWVDEMAAVVDSGRPTAFTRKVGALSRWYEGRAFGLQGDRFAVLFLEVTERTLADWRRGALIELDDRLRDRVEIADMSHAAAEIIGRTLDVDRAGYGTVSGTGDTVEVARDWTSAGLAGLGSPHQMRDYGSYIDDLRRGDTVVIDNVACDPRTRDNASALQTLSVAALVNVPLLEFGQLVAFLFVSCATTRAWTEEEVNFIRNVTERTRSSVERRRAEHKLQQLAVTLEQQVEERTNERDRLWQLSDDLLVVADYEGGILHVSPSWTRLLGYSETDLLTGTYERIIHPDDFAAVMDALTTMRESGKPARFEDRLLAADGTWKWTSWTLSPEPGGRRLTGVGRDITEQRRIEEQLRQSQKMEAVGQLTGGLAHDFNNLLTGITGSLELLQTRVAQGRLTDVDRYVNAAQGAAKRAAALTHRLLAFSRRQTLEPKSTDINRLVAGMQELVQRTVGPEIAVESVAAGGLWNTLIDPGQLENALLNLCINARDAMPGGGKLTIETGNRWLDQRAAQERELTPGQYVSLCVSDTGTGMPADVIARAFDPFFTTKPIGQGTGLGLSMIYGFARQSGGQVRIYSEVGDGTMVCLYLPRHVGSADAGGTEADLAEAPRAEAGETVLVVDDEPTVRMLVTDVLEELGYTAIEAADGASGLKVLQSDVRIDLLVTDVGLPGGMNGRQVADAARIARPKLKVLFITGYAENAVLSHGHLDPGMHVLTKPFAMETLASRIKDLISG